MKWALGVAVVVLLLAAVCSGKPQCRKALNCELIHCGVPLCAPDEKLELGPCSCCPGCVPNPDYEAPSEEQVRRRRTLGRTSGTAQLQAKKHSYKVQGFNIPEMYMHLLEKAKARAKDQSPSTALPR